MRKMKKAIAFAMTALLTLSSMNGTKVEAGQGNGNNGWKEVTVENHDYCDGFWIPFSTWFVHFDVCVNGVYHVHDNGKSGNYTHVAGQGAQYNCPLCHTHILVDVQEKAATCAEAGNTAGQKCTTCDYTTVESIAINPDAHAYGDWSEVKTSATQKYQERVCANDASHVETKVVAVKTEAYFFISLDGKASSDWTKHFNAADYTPSIKTGYFWLPVGAADTWGSSDVAAYVDDDQLPSKAQIEAAVKDVKTVTCKQDVKVEWIVIKHENNGWHIDGNAMNSHNPVSADNAVEPTCTDDGKEADTVCSECGETLEVGATIEALGHDYQVDEESAVEPTCTEEGKEADQVCSRCEDRIVGATIEALGHDYQVDEESAVEPTCTEEGKEADQVCSRCEDRIVGATIPAAGHVAGERVIENVVVATVNSLGSFDVVVYCDVCGVELSRDTFYDALPVVPAEEPTPAPTEAPVEPTPAPTETPVPTVEPTPAPVEPTPVVIEDEETPEGTVEVVVDETPVVEEVVEEVEEVIEETVEEVVEEVTEETEEIVEVEVEETPEGTVDVEIEDEETPEGTELPKTGLASSVSFMAAGAAVILAGAAIVLRKKEENA